MTNGPEERRRRRNWAKFINKKRKQFVPSNGSWTCSKQFRPEDFTIRYTPLPGHEKAPIPRL